LRRPPIDQQKLEQKIENEGQEGERHHKEQMTSIDTLRMEIAREKGVPAEVLAPLFENLGMKGLTLDQMREEAAEAIKAILARARSNHRRMTRILTRRLPPRVRNWLVSTRPVPRQSSTRRSLRKKRTDATGLHLFWQRRQPSRG
jgi:hypothetical protein